MRGGLFPPSYCDCFSPSLPAPLPSLPPSLFLSPLSPPPSPLQSWPSDTTKIRSVLGGWLYAYELPETALLPTTQRADSPDELLRKQKLKKVNRARTLSLKHIGEARGKAAKVREKLARQPLGSHREREGEGEGKGEEPEEEGGVTSPKRRKVESAEVIGELKENGVNHETAHISERGVGVAGEEEGGGVAREEEEEMETRDSDEVSNRAMEQQLAGEVGYVFAVHRRLVRSPL